MAYQIAFDLYESATQHFLTRILETLNALLPQKQTATVSAAEATSASSVEKKSSEDEEKAKTNTDDQKDDKVEEYECLSINFYNLCKYICYLYLNYFIVFTYL